MSVGWPGWMADVYTYWHRARYGWAPRDTWGLDGYLEKVLGGALDHLADKAHGVPGGYPNPDWDGEEASWDSDAGYAQWQADLHRWALAFRESAEGVEIYDRADGYVQHNAEEARRNANRETALREMTIWWQALWN